MRGRILRGIHVVALTLLMGCGGGTQGTSDTGDRSVKGAFVDGGGRPIASQPMTVAEAGSEEPIVTSSTDEQGRFTMEAPRDIRALRVDLPRQNAEVRVDNLAAEASHLQLKVRLIDSSTQESQRFEYDLGQEGSCLAGAGCTLNIFARGESLPTDSFTLRVVGVCGEESARLITEQQLSVNGGGTIEIAQARLQGCSELVAQLESPIPGLPVEEEPLS
jgi:hypothetical protein